LIATEITARPETLAARLAARGRESAEDIAARLSRTDALPPAPVDLSIPNDDAPDKASGVLLSAVRQGAMTCA
jgi:ribose 1,5-bisphosphokinase PhnN